MKQLFVYHKIFIPGFWSDERYWEYVDILELFFDKFIDLLAID